MVVSRIVVSWIVVSRRVVSRRVVSRGVVSRIVVSRIVVSRRVVSWIVVSRRVVTSVRRKSDGRKSDSRKLDSRKTESRKSGSRKSGSGCIRSIRVMTSDRGRPKYTQKNPPHCHVFPYKLHMTTGSGIEPGPPTNHLSYRTPLGLSLSDFMFVGNVRNLWMADGM
jgi:hypothetical protein